MPEIPNHDYLPPTLIITEMVCICVDMLTVHLLSVKPLIFPHHVTEYTRQTTCSDHRQQLSSAGGRLVAELRRRDRQSEQWNALLHEPLARRPHHTRPEARQL